MALKLLASVIFVVAVAVYRSDADCNTVRLTSFEIYNKNNGEIVTHKIRLGGEKRLYIKLGFIVGKTLDAPSYNYVLTVSAVVKTIFGTLPISLPDCPIPTCNLQGMTCSQMDHYLGFNKYGCPLPSGDYRNIVYPPDNTALVVGDLYSKIPSKYQWAIPFISQIVVTGRLDISSDRDGVIACIRESITLVK